MRSVAGAANVAEEAAVSAAEEGEGSGTETKLLLHKIAEREDIGMKGMTFRQQISSKPFLVVLGFMAVHVLQVNFYVVCGCVVCVCVSECCGVSGLARILRGAAAGSGFHTDAAGYRISAVDSDGG